MTLLDGSPDMGQTVFSDDDLTWARRFLVNLLKIQDPTWLRKPIGPLAVYWNTADASPHSAAYLIHVAQVLDPLRIKTSAVSHPTMRRKIRELFRAPTTGSTFDDLLAELEFGSTLSPFASPIIFEPLAVGLAHRGDTPKSPDYGIVLPDEFVILEVTRIQYGFMSEWDQGTAAAAEQFKTRASRRRLRRAISFTAPIMASRGDLLQLASPQILDDFEQHEQGARHFAFAAGPAQLQWSAIPEHDTDAEFAASTKPLSINNDRELVQSAIAISYDATFDGVNLEERVLTSIRNSLRAKRRQMTAETPYILVAEVPQSVNQDAVSNLLFRRLFPNRDHEWISGISLFKPARMWHAGSPPSLLDLHANPRARYVVSDPLRQADYVLVGDEVIVNNGPPAPARVDTVYRLGIAAAVRHIGVRFCSCHSSRVAAVTDRPGLTPSVWGAICRQLVIQA